MAATSNERNSPQPDRILVGLIQPANQGTEFERIPLHVTLLHWYSLPRGNQAVINNALVNRTYRMAPLELIGEERDEFGPNHDVPVTKLRVGSLAAFHAMAIDIVENQGASVHSPYVRELYAPHVSDVGDEQFPIGGDPVVIDKVQLIAADRETGIRRVEEVFSLQKGRHDAPTARF
jgi:hypothetical protein